MANPDHLERLLDCILSDDIESWNRWKASKVISFPTLTERDLSSVHFMSNDLRRSGLHFGALSQVDLSRVDLSGFFVLKEGTPLVGGGANLQNADLSWTDFRGANLRDVNLRNANAFGSNFKGAYIGGADLANADFRWTDLSGMDLEGSDLNSTNFSGSIMSAISISRANIGAAKGLDRIRWNGKGYIDVSTIEQPWPLPITFMRGMGLPESLIEYLPSIMNQAIEFYSCFISYNHSDKKFAQRLHDQLQGRGIRCWLDDHQMLPGDDIYEQIQQGIKIWDKVLLCCSQSSLTSWWVDNEIDSAFSKERSLMKDRGEKVRSLIPLDLDGYLFSGRWNSGKEEQIKSRVAANFRGWDKNNDLFEMEFEKVVKALRSDGGGRETPPVARL